MAKAPPDTDKPKSSPIRRWLMRALKALGLMLLLILILHRPLIRWAADYFGRKVAKAAGLDAQWTLEGNYLQSVGLKDVKIKGDEAAQLQALSLDEAEVRFDLWALRKEGPGTMLKEVVLHNLNAEIDLTKAQTSITENVPDNSATTSPPPAISWPRVEITHSTIRIRLLNGEWMELKDFNLLLDKSKPGIISWENLAVPGMEQFGPMSGTTRLTATTLSLEKMRLRPESLIETLAVDISQLAKEQIGLAFQLQQGSAKVEIHGSVSQWSQDLATQTEVEIENLTSEDVRPWVTEAAHVPWTVALLQFHAQGPVLRPKSLQVSISMERASATVAGLPLQIPSLRAALSSGTLRLSTLQAAVGDNTALLTAEAALPSNWEAAADAPGQANLVIQANNLHELASPLEGKGKVKAEIKFAGQAVESGDLAADATPLVIEGISIAAAKARIAAAGSEISLTDFTLTLNKQNSAHVAGTFHLDAENPWSAQWEVNCPDLSTVPVSLRGESIWPSAGRVMGTGEAAGTMKAIQESRWEQLRAKARLEAKSVQIKAAKLDHLQLQAQAEHGDAKVETLELQLNAENYVRATGQLGFTDSSLPLSANLEIVLPKASLLSAWSQSFGGPEIAAGSTTANWQAHGHLQPMSLEGAGNINVQQLEIQGIPEPLALKAAVTQSPDAISVPKLTAHYGPWRAVGALHYAGQRLEIPVLNGFLQDSPLVTLMASIPINFRNDPLELEFQTQSLDVHDLAAELGSSLPANASAKASGKFSGTLETLAGKLDVEVSNVTPLQMADHKLPPGRVLLRFLLSEGTAKLEATLGQLPLRDTSIHASAPVDLPMLLEKPDLAGQIPITAQISLPSSSMAFVPQLIPAIERLDGSLGAEVSVSGTVTQPRFSGSLHADIPEVVMADNSLPSIKQVRTNLQARDQEITIHNASLMASGGTLRLNGRASLQNLADPAFSLALKAEEMLLLRDDLISLRANADIHCEGKLSAAAVAGHVDLVRGRVYKEVEIIPMSLPNELPPPPASTKLAKNGPPQLPNFLHPWTFDVAIRTKDPIRLLSTLAHGNAEVDLKLSGTGANPDLSGKVSLKETWLKLPFSRMNISNCDVLFTKEKPFDPVLELVGESFISNYVVSLHASGPAMDPTLRFTSSPPLPEGDITYLIATGTTPNDLNANNGEAAGRAIFLVFKTAYRKLFPKLAAVAEDRMPPRISFELSGFGNDPSRRGVAAIYEITPKLKAIGRMQQDGRMRGMLYYQIRFK